MSTLRDLDKRATEHVELSTAILEGAKGEPVAIDRALVAAALAVEARLGMITELLNDLLTDGLPR